MPRLFTLVTALLVAGTGSGSNFTGSSANRNPARRISKTNRKCFPIEDNLSSSGFGSAAVLAAVRGTSPPRGEAEQLLRSGLRRGPYSPGAVFAAFGGPATLLSARVPGLLPWVCPARRGRERPRDGAGKQAAGATLFPENCACPVRILRAAVLMRPNFRRLAVCLGFAGHQHHLGAIAGGSGAAAKRPRCFDADDYPRVKCCGFQRARQIAPENLPANWGLAHVADRSHPWLARCACRWLQTRNSSIGLL